MKPPDDFELIEVVVVTIMGLTDENNSLGCELCDEIIQRKGRVQIDRFKGSGFGVSAVLISPVPLRWPCGRIP
jgi:hypothetical protein